MEVGIFPSFCTFTFPAICAFVNKVPISITTPAEGKLIWSPSTSGELTAKEAYSFFKPINPPLIWGKLIWAKYILPRISLLAWKVLRGRVLSEDYLHRRGISLDSVYRDYRGTVLGAFSSTFDIPSSVDAEVMVVIKAIELAWYYIMTGEEASEEPIVNVVQDEPKLQLGQEFESVEEAYHFYNDIYAKVVGFSVRMGSNKKNKVNREITWKQFLCSKEGKSDETPTEERNFGMKRTGCKARLNIIFNKTSKKWCVSDFEEAYTHALTTPKRVHLLASHRKLTKAKKCLMGKLSSVNVPLSQQFKIMETVAGGISNVGCVPRDLRNDERNLREELKGHDATMLLEYFESEKEKKPSFYFQVDRDENNRMKRCFWADPTSKKSYYFFNDVVVFDTMYNTNKYNMIFAPITGVNHHGQTIVFGCGLLSDEKTESFIWLLEQWLKAMPSGPPKIGPVIAQNYYGIFKSNVYKSETREEFEASWKNALQQSNQEAHVWLNTMYELRSKCVPAFCNHIFHAENNSLFDFATRIERGLRQQRHEELIRDHVDSNETPKTRTFYPIEKQMREVYTKEIFLRFQDELVKSTAYLKCEIEKEDESECMYMVIRAPYNEQSWKRRHIFHDKVSGFAKCSYGGFEIEGIACRHIIFFFRSMNMVHLPSEYILDRWTKNAKVGRVWDDDGVEVKDVGDKTLLMRYIQLSQLSQALIDEASLSQEATKYFTDGLNSLRVGIKELHSSLGVEESPSTSKRKPEQILIEEPSQVKAKGSGKRLKSSKEIAMNKQKHCGKCGQTGHNILTCEKHNTDM
ncbi:protein FAR1-RELATED SEQUENCE 5-like [Argentina anserina]|uniref:protein FAR1-RELATED SEQUENCE 5-like n=1 Tax=Argentina anserina TaxID=57926 RepID=UPI0021765C91|nr:protein FAR1-RELATED SEQUENCE 5-like [Potentilla anserina]